MREWSIMVINDNPSNPHSPMLIHALLSTSKNMFPHPAPVSRAHSAQRFLWLLPLLPLLRISLPNCCTVRRPPLGGSANSLVAVSCGKSMMFKTFQASFSDNSVIMCRNPRNSAKLWTFKKDVETQSWFPWLCWSLVVPVSSECRCPCISRTRRSRGFPELGSEVSIEPFLLGVTAVFDMEVSWKWGIPNNQ